MRKRWRSLARRALPVVAALLCCGLLLYWLHHQRMQDHPELLYPYYESRLSDYGRRLSAGDVNYEEVRKYGIPQYLIDHGAQYCTRHGDCFCVSFGAFLDNPTPELWYSPTGFDPMPGELAEMNRGRPKHQWIPLAPQWAACYR